VAAAEAARASAYSSFSSIDSGLPTRQPYRTSGATNHRAFPYCPAQWPLGGAMSRSSRSRSILGPSLAPEPLLRAQQPSTQEKLTRQRYSSRRPNARRPGKTIVPPSRLCSTRIRFVRPNSTWVSRPDWHRERVNPQPGARSALK
jgi:hypothetical protein